MTAKRKTEGSNYSRTRMYRTINSDPVQHEWMRKKAYELDTPIVGVIDVLIKCYKEHHPEEAS